MKTIEPDITDQFYDQYRKAKITKQFTLFNFLANILYLLNDVFIGHVDYLVQIDICVVVFYGLLHMYMVKSNNQHITAIILASTLNIWLYFSADLYGKDSLLFIFLFTLSLMTFFLFSKNDKHLFYFFLSLPIIEMLALIVTDFGLFDESSFTIEEIKTTSILAIVGNMFLYYIFINGIISSMDAIETLFQKDKMTLVDNAQKLKVLNDKVSTYNDKLNDELSIAKKNLHEQQKLNEFIRNQTEENERSRISKELHDTIGVLLSTSKLKLEGYLTNNNTESLEIDGVITLIDNAIREVRYLSHNMQPVLFSELRLIKVLEDLLIQINSLEKGIKINLLSKDYNNQLSVNNELVLFRILMELINNILKHSQAKEAIVQIIALEDAINVSVEDDGIGFDSSEIKKGHGLANCEFRINMLDARLNISSNIGKGTLIQIQLPIK